jgi:hypothetical protein
MPTAGRLFGGRFPLLADLAEAETALLQWKRSSSPLGEARYAEYRDLVRDVAAQLEATLDRN